MSDQSFAGEAEADFVDNDAQDADEGERYAELEKRVGGEEGDDEPSPQKNWQEEAEKSEKKFQDQQKRAKAERREKQALAKRLEELEARFNAKPAKADADDDDDFGDELEDPIAVLSKLKKLGLQLKEGEKQEKLSAAEQEKAATRERGLATTLSESEADFRKVKPDYDKAVTFFKTARASELIDQGYDKDELPGVLKREFLELIERADKTDKDPAEVVYALAMRRGYSLDAGKEKLQTIANGQKAGRSLSSAGGRNGDASEMTYARAAQLKGPALLKAFAQIKEQEKRQARR